MPERPNRARQNVILELGYFIGKLGRSRVAVLLAPGTEQPSDILGIAYIPLDRDGAWRLLVGRELKAGGVEVDLNRLA
jgi:predicted nucleotide-binding protein